MAAFIRSRKFQLLAVALVAAAAVSSLHFWLFWQQTAREFVKQAYYAITGADFRPDLNRFGHDQILEFAETPAVYLGVIDPESPDYRIRRGFEINVDSAGYTYPVNVVFPQNAGQDADDPRYYVAELHGNIKYTDRAGKVHTFASDLLEFPPTEMRISDEFGISGLAIIPGTHDLLITHPVNDPDTNLFFNAITRLHSKDGRSIYEKTTVLTLVGEHTCPSNQIQQISFGPDGKLYVSVGDAMNFALSKDLSKWGGKVLRMNLDGSACKDNPFYNVEKPSSPESYVFASGLRNCFDFVFDRQNNTIWAGDVGKVINRLVNIHAGSDLGWDGTEESFCRNPAYLFQDRFVPVGITQIDPAVMGKEFDGCVWLAGYSGSFGPGPGRSKRIISFRIQSGRIVDGPTGVLEYIGQSQSTLLGLTQGPDGVYAVDFFGDQTGGDATGMGRVMRITTSERTSQLPLNNKPSSWDKWSNLERGKYLFTSSMGCGKCHTVLKLSAGLEGPELTHLATHLRERLGSAEYQEAASLIASENPRVQAEIEEVLNSSDDARLRIWLQHHIRNPKFDNPKAKMPAFDPAFYSDEDVDLLIDLLLTFE